MWAKSILWPPLCPGRISGRRYSHPKLVMKMVNADCHRIHLKALIQRERDVAYQRQCYPSDGWRAGLPSGEGGTMRGADAATKTTTMPSRSPTSLDEAPTTRRLLGSPQTVMTPPSTFSIYSPSYVVGGAEAMSEKIGVLQRDRIIEWMYQVVDRLGEQISFPCSFSCVHSSHLPFACTTVS